MNEIIPNLWLGNFIDGEREQDRMAVLCVMWDGEPNIPQRAKHIQTTDYQTFQEYNGQVVQAEGVTTNTAKMDEAADWIHEKLTTPEPVLVHCAYGMERSPLTVLWYLMRYHDMNLKQAYDLLMERRKEVQYRGTWLPIEVRLNGTLPERVTL